MKKCHVNGYRILCQNWSLHFTNLVRLACEYVNDNEACPQRAISLFDRPPGRSLE
jgi:hypothetical protein